jgi:hypothetical protein
MFYYTYFILISSTQSWSRLDPHQATLLPNISARSYAKGGSCAARHSIRDDCLAGSLSMRLRAGPCPLVALFAKNVSFINRFHVFAAGIAE